MGKHFMHNNFFKNMYMLLIVLSITSFFFEPVYANMAAPPEPNAGNITGNSPLNDITVLEELLDVNLSNIADGGLAEVTAKYRVKCDKDIEALDLIFIANNLNDKSYEVKLDGESISGDITVLTKVPSIWLPPQSISWKDKQVGYQYVSDGLISFQIDRIGEGEHNLEVYYKAAAPESYEGDVTIIRTFVYILKTTDDWKSMNNLNLVVHLPDNWDYTSNLDLKKESSNTLTGKWDDLPAEYFSIAINKSPILSNIVSVAFYIVSWILVLASALFWMFKVAGYQIKNNKSIIIHFLNSVFVSFVVSIFFYIIYFSEKDIRSWMLGQHMSPYVTRGINYTILFFPFVWFVFGIVSLIVSFIMTVIIRKRIKSEV